MISNKLSIVITNSITNAINGNGGFNEKIKKLNEKKSACNINDEFEISVNEHDIQNVKLICNLISLTFF